MEKTVRFGRSTGAAFGDDVTETATLPRGQRGPTCDSAEFIGDERPPALGAPARRHLRLTETDEHSPRGGRPRHTETTMDVSAETFRDSRQRRAIRRP